MTIFAINGVPYQTNSIPVDGLITLSDGRQVKINLMNENKISFCFLNSIQNSSNDLKISAAKPYAVNQTFTLYAHASSSSSYITSIEWFPYDTCSFAENLKANSAALVSSLADSSAQFVCSTSGVKYFTVTSKSSNGGYSKDSVAVYVNEDSASLVIVQPTNITTPTNITPVINLNSCKGRCQQYSSTEKCQCDSSCEKYNDCCSDKKSVCG